MRASKHTGQPKKSLFVFPAHIEILGKTNWVTGTEKAANKLELNLYESILPQCKIVTASTILNATGSYYTEELNTITGSNLPSKK